MNTEEAFMRGQLNRLREQKVFDWDLAATLIKENHATNASAGLAGDWEWTGGLIFEGGKPVPHEDTYTYLASTWATPELVIDGFKLPCYRMASETPGWDAETYWPESALAILEDAA